MKGPRERFAKLAQRPAAELDLAEAALLVAAEEYPDLDITAYQGRLDALAAEAELRLAGAATDSERLSRLNDYVFRERGFTGNREHYDDPRNSFLNEVIDRRLGLPITLAIVYIEVGRRLHLPLCGVGFPGHFLAKLEGEPEVLVDAFFGRSVTRSECAQRLRAALGSDAELIPEQHLRAATPHEILVRLLTNLKQLYVRDADWLRALGCCDRILLLIPDAPSELRDRGLVYEQLECFAAAASDLERFLEIAPQAERTGPLRARLSALRRRVGPLH